MWRYVKLSWFSQSFAIATDKKLLGKQLFDKNLFNQRLADSIYSPPGPGKIKWFIYTSKMSTPQNKGLYRPDTSPPPPKKKKKNSTGGGDMSVSLEYMLLGHPPHLTITTLLFSLLHHHKAYYWHNPVHAPEFNFPLLLTWFPKINLLIRHRYFCEVTNWKYVYAKANLLFSIFSRGGERWFL